VLVGLLLPTANVAFGRAEAKGLATRVSTVRESTGVAGCVGLARRLQPLRLHGSMDPIR
jgi:hypothetical protein